MTDIQQTIQAFLVGTSEVRVLGIRGKGPWSGFASKSAIGFFDSASEMETSIRQVEDYGQAKGIYVTLNPVKSDLLARANNRLKANAAGSGDEHVDCVRWIPIDIDPVHVTGISSSESELEEAAVIAKKLCVLLAENGIEWSIKALSGNGYHVLLAVEMETGQETTKIIKDFLVTLDQLLSDKTTKIDSVNYNHSRIWKVYGTTARKGDSTIERPHRKAKILANAGRKIISIERISSFVRSHLVKQSAPTSSNEFDLKSYLVEHGIEIIKTKQHGDSTLFCLDQCVFNPEHNSNEAAFGQTSGGVIFYQCFHDSCKDKTWHDAKKIIGWDDKLCHRMSSNVIDCHNASSTRHQLVTNSSLSVSSKPIALLVKEFIGQSTGTFTVFDIDSELCLRTRHEKNARSVELNRLRKQGVIKQSKVRRAEWRVVDGQLKAMDLTKIKPKSLPIALPLGIHELVHIYPGNIIVIAGSPNAGKSAYVSSLIRESNNILTNLGSDVSKTVFEQMAPFMCPQKKQPNVHFFSSEAGAEEMSSRLAEHPGGLDSFKGVHFWERNSNFADVIDPVGVNVIDYLEVYDNFYEIGSWINDIHRELKTGIAIIVIQKKRGAEVGKGGDVTLEKPRLYITLENNAPYGGICKIVKAKFPADHRMNPNGMEMDYNLSHGWEFTKKSSWRYVDESDRKKINRGYSSELSAGGYMFNFQLMDGGTAGLNANTCYDWTKEYSNINVMDCLEDIERDCRRKSFMMKKNWFWTLSGILAKKDKQAQPAS